MRNKITVENIENKLTKRVLDMDWNLCLNKDPGEMQVRLGPYGDRNTFAVSEDIVACLGVDKYVFDSSITAEEIIKEIIPDGADMVYVEDIEIAKNDDSKVIVSIGYGKKDDYIRAMSCMTN